MFPPRPSPPGRPRSPTPHPRAAPPGHPTSGGGGDRCRQPHLGKLRPAVARSGSPSPATTCRGKPAIPALPSNSLPRGEGRHRERKTPPLPPRARPAARGPDSSLLSGDEGRHSPTEVEVGCRDNLPARHHLWREKQPFSQRAELPYSSRGQTMNAALWRSNRRPPTLPTPRTPRLDDGRRPLRPTPALHLRKPGQKPGRAAAPYSAPCAILSPPSRPPPPRGSGANTRGRASKQ